MNTKIKAGDVVYSTKHGCRVTIKTIDPETKTFFCVWYDSAKRDFCEEKISFSAYKAI